MYPIIFYSISSMFVNYFLEVPFMNQQDKEWKEEQSRIDEVLKELEKKERFLETSAGGLKHDIIGLRKS